MTIAKVQGYYAGTGTTSATATFGATPTQNNLLVACGRSSVVIGNWSMPAGWVLAISALVTSTYTAAIYYKIAGASEPTDVQLSCTGAGVTDLFVTEWSGLSSNVSTILDQTAKTDSTGGAVTSRSSGTTGTTTVADELCMAAVGQGNTTSAQSFSNSFTMDDRGYTAFQSAYLIASSKATQETTDSWTTARYAGGCIATFKTVVPGWGGLLSGLANRLVVGEV